MPGLGVHIPQPYIMAAIAGHQGYIRASITTPLPKARTIGLIIQV